MEVLEAVGSGPADLLEDPRERRLVEGRDVLERAQVPSWRMTGGRPSLRCTSLAPSCTA